MNGHAYFFTGADGNTYMAREFLNGSGLQECKLRITMNSPDAPGAPANRWSPDSPAATKILMPRVEASWATSLIAVIACADQELSGPPQLRDITEGLLS